MNIPDYTLLQSCGRGAYGQVWLAQSQTNKLVALKYVAYTQAGEREFEGLVNFSKLPEAPNLIRILHLGKLEDGFFYTMELADGLYSQGVYVPESLAERIKRQNRLSPAEVMELAFAMLGALNSLHASGLIHRDIKPENILYVNGVPKLSDMGLVRDAEGTISLCGTIGFIPPERLVPGQTCLCDKGDDLYALGKVLYCALTGHAVEKFPSFSEDMIGNTVCSHLNRVILKACGEPAERFANADEFISALKNGVEQNAVSRLHSVGGNKKLVAAAGLTFMLLAGAGLGYFLTGRTGDHAMSAEHKALEDEREKLEEERKKLEAQHAVRAEFDRREEVRREEDRKKAEEDRKRSEASSKRLKSIMKKYGILDDEQPTLNEIQELKQEREKLEAERKKLEEERKKLEAQHAVRAEFDRREEVRREEDRKKAEEKEQRDQMAKAALFGGAGSPVVEDVKEEDDETAGKIQELKQEREKLEAERKKLETANQIRQELDRREEARREEDRKRGKVIVTSE